VKTKLENRRAGETGDRENAPGDDTLLVMRVSTGVRAADTMQPMPPSRRGHARKEGALHGARSSRFAEIRRSHVM